MNLFQKKEIWKLQRPLYSSDGSQEILGYTKDNKRTAFIAMDLDDVNELFEDDAKVYALARVQNGNLVIIKKVEEQDW